MTKPARLRDTFPHAKLEVYHVASAFFIACWRLSDRFPARDGFLRSQFLRAALSIKLNISEGAAEIRPGEKARLYRLARRSAGECAAMLDDFPETLGIPESQLQPFYVEVTRISHMLMQLIHSVEKRGRGKLPRKN